MQWYRLCLLYISNFSYILNTSLSSYNLQGYIFSTFSQSLCPLKIASVIYKKKLILFSISPVLPHSSLSLFQSEKVGSILMNYST